MRCIAGDASAERGVGFDGVYRTMQSDSSSLRAASPFTAYKFNIYITTSMARSHSTASVALLWLQRDDGQEVDLLLVQHHAQPATIR